MTDRPEKWRSSNVKGRHAVGFAALILSMAAIAIAADKPSPPTTRPATSPTSLPTTSPASQPTTRASAPATKPATQAVRHTAPRLARISPQVRSLVDQLSADDWSAREAAVTSLVALGDEMLPQFEAALAKSRDPEVRSRLESAIARVEEMRQVGASLITLNLQKVPASEAFAELARQARGPLPTEPATLLSGKSDKQVSLKVDRRPFWEVMELLCKQADVEPACLNRQNREIGLGLVRAGENGDSGGRNWANRPMVHSGPLLIRAENISHHTSISLRDPAENSNEFMINLAVMSEPKLKVLDYSGTAKLDEAVDELGNSLLPPDDNGVPANVETYGNAHGGSPAAWSVGATLAYPKNPGKRIVKLRGSVSVEVQTRSAKVELPIQSSRGVSLDLDGVRLKVKSVDGARAEISVYRDGRNDADWFHLRTLLSTTEAQLVSDKGQTVARTQMGVEADESDDSQRMDVRLRFSRDGEDDNEPRLGKRMHPREANRKVPDGTKFVWEIPVETREVVVPFVFRDLPIPR